MPGASVDLRHPGGIGQKHYGADERIHLGRNLSQQRGEGGVGEDRAILGVVDDEGDVVGGEPRIDGVADRAHAGDAVVELEMAVVVPGERRHAIAETDAELLERAREPPAAALDLGVGGAVERGAAEVGNHLRAAAMPGGMDDEGGNQQWIALHQPKHQTCLRLALEWPWLRALNLAEWRA